MIEVGNKRQKKWSINKNKFLSVEEYARLRFKIKKRQNRPAILLKLLMFTGARAREALAVRLIDLDKAEKTVFIRGLKQSADREIPLPPWYFSQLYRYALNHCEKPEDKIFPFCYTILYRIWNIYRPCNKTIHSLRHTIAINVFEQTRDIKLVQVLLGHRSINNTMVYLDFVYSRQEMKRILSLKY